MPADIGKTTAAIRLQRYIYQVRPKIQDEDSARPTACAARTYQEPAGSGMGPPVASLRASRLLGRSKKAGARSEKSGGPSCAVLARVL